MNYFAPLNYVGNTLDKVGRSLGSPANDLGVSEFLSNLGKTPQASTGLNYNPQYGPVASPNAPKGQTDAGGVDPFTAALQAISNAGAGSGSSTAVPPTVFNGRTFNLQDPQERVNYFNAVNSNNFATANQNYDLTHNNILQSIGNLTRSKEQGLADINRAQGDLGTSRQNYFNQSQKQGQDFTDQYGLGSVNRSQTFASLSPNAYQSSQGTSQDFAEKKYLQGLGDMQAADAQAGTQFDQQASDLSRSRDNFGIDYEQTLKSLQQQDSQAGQARDNYINQNRDQVASSLMGADQNQGLTNYAGRYSISPFDPTSVKSADLSAYTPYTNFQGLQASPVAAAGTASSVKPNSTLSPQSNYFGYAPSQANKDYLTNYFKSGNIN